MALSQNVSRDAMIASAEATETTTAAFISTASIDEVRIVTAQGGAPSAAGDIMILSKNNDGTLKKSRIIKLAEIDEIVAKAVVAPVETKFDFVALAAPVVGDAYKANVRVFNAGSQSVNQWHNYIGEFVATDTNQETVVDGLVASLNKNMSTTPGATATTNPYFSFAKGFGTQVLTVTTAPTADDDSTITIDGTAYTVALLDADTVDGAATKIKNVVDALTGYTATVSTDEVTITADSGKAVTVSFAGGASGSDATIAGTATTAALVVEALAQPLDLGKDEGRRIEFIADLYTVADSEKTPQGTSIKTGGHDGTGNYKQIANLEFFTKGNYGDIYRGMGYPNNFSTVSQTALNTDYHTIDIKFVHEGNGISVHKVPGTVTIAVSAAGGVTEVNKVINNLETATGFTIADLS